MTKQVNQINEVIDETTGEVLRHEDYGVDEPESTSTSLISFDSTAMSTIHGFNMPSGLGFEQKVEILAFLTDFVGGESEKVDRYLNTVIDVAGVIQHDATVNVSASSGKFDSDGNDIVVTRTRTVIMVTGKDGKKFDEPRKIAFVAKSADSFFKSSVVPLLGYGLWPDTVKMIVRRTSVTRGQAYSFQIVK